jgi:hypothetical protein
MLSRGIRGGGGGLARPAARMAAAALVVIAMAAAIWAGPLAGAGAGTRSHAASPPPARVKFYVVPPPGDGRAESLFAIAATTLGDGGRFMEIFNLNKGRLQPNGGRLTIPQTIETGWILRLPADAAGPRVHVGLLSAVTPTASPRPLRPAAGVAASSYLPSLWGRVGSAMVISGALLVFLAAGLAFGLTRRRATPRRAPMRPRPPRPSAADRYMASPPAPAPSGWAPAPSGWSADDWGPSAPTAPVTPEWAADLATAPAPPPQTFQDAGPAQVVPAEPWASDPEGAAGPGTGAQGTLRLPEDQGTAPADPSGTEESARLANWILFDADHQTAEIRQQAAYQAGHIRDAAERDAAERDAAERDAAERDAAEREAAEQEAAEQEAAEQEAAEQEAAELRATLMEMSAELGRVAAQVTGILQSTAMPATAPADGPGHPPASRPTTKSATRPAERATMPGGRPARPAKPAAKPAARSRQFRAARLPVLAMGVAILFGLIAATTQLALHGYDFFIFRAPGTGATQDGPSGSAPSQPPAAQRHDQAKGCAQAGTQGAPDDQRPDEAQAACAEGR